MYNRAKMSRACTLLAAVGVIAVSAGCAGLPLEASWPDVSLFGTPPQIMYVYADQARLIDPVDGSTSELRDSQGDVRLDDAGNPRTWAVQQPASGAVTFYTRPIALDEDTLYLTAYENKLFEIDPVSSRIANDSGVALPGHVVATPLLGANLLYVPLSETNLVALDSETFDTSWTHSTERGVWATPLLHEGVLYVPSMDHILYALDADTGEERWRLDLEGAVASTPVIANNHLYVGSFGRKLFKIGLDGVIVASIATTEWIWGAPLVIDDEVYVADLGGWVYALLDQGDSFETVWSRQVATRGIRPTPLVTEDSVIVGSRDKFVYWVSRTTGDEQVKRELRGDVLSELLLLQPDQIGGIDEAYVVVSTLAREELLVAFTLDDGERKWVYP